MTLLWNTLSACRPTSLIWLCCLAQLALSKGIYEPGDPAKFKSYEMPTPASGPCDITEGPDGLVYIQELFADQFARLNQTSGEITEYNIPFTLPATSGPTIPLPGGLDKAVLAACALRTGFDGYLYLSNGLHNQLVQHDVKTGKTVVFTPPGITSALGNLEPLNDVTTAPGGVYFSMTSANAVAKFDYMTHEFTTYTAPTPLAGVGGIFYSDSDPDAIYFGEFTASKIGRLDQKTGNITEFETPGCGPFAIRAQTTDSKTGQPIIWFACAIGSALGGLNIVTGDFISIPTITPEALPLEVAQDYAGHIFVTYAAVDRLGVYNTNSGQYSEIGIPGALIDGLPVASLPPFLGNGIFGNPVQSPTFGHGGIGNAIFFSETSQNLVVRYDLSGFSVP